jgi:hypothetical protein
LRSFGCADERHSWRGWGLKAAEDVVEIRVSAA